MPTAATPLARPVHDPNAAYPELARLLSATTARDWTAVETLLSAHEDAQDLAVAARTVADTAGADRMLAEALAAAGDGPAGVLPRSLLAFHHIRTGWTIRSGYRAQYVSAERFAQFHDHLRQAERLLIEAVAIDPSHALGWHLRLMTARGLELGRSEARRRYDRLAAHRPNHYPAQAQLLQQLCPKWGGSWEAVHAFADECRRTAEPGGLGALVTVEAHLEHWMDLDDAAQHTYWWGAGVREGLLEAAQDSVLHPDFRGGLNNVLAHTLFAAAYSFSGQPALAAPHFETLGTLTTEYPWSSVGGTWQGLWQRHRAAALATTGRKA